MSDDEKKVAIAVPGEWALQKAFGPVLTEFGEDLKRLYAVGRDKILAAGYKKIEDIEDGKQANPRVTRDVLWNGAFSDDDVCAEYFGGILAASRSEDGKNDDSIQFVDVIKALSSRQLHMHYVIYNCLNKLWVASNVSVNVAQGSDIQRQQVWLSQIELISVLKLRVDTDLNVLHKEGLLHTTRLTFCNAMVKLCLMCPQIQQHSESCCTLIPIIVSPNGGNLQMSTLAISTISLFPRFTHVR